MSKTTALQRLKVLLVEDEYLIAHDVCTWLKQAGASVVGPARDLQESLDLLEGHEVDVAVIDINLGAGAQFMLAEQLSRRCVPFLFATGYGSESIPGDFQSVPRLEKPFGQAQLIETLTRMAVSGSAAHQPSPSSPTTVSR